MLLSLLGWREPEKPGHVVADEVVVEDVGLVAHREAAAGLVADAFLPRRDLDAGTAGPAEADAVRGAVQLSGELLGGLAVPERPAGRGPGPVELAAAGPVDDLRAPAGQVEVAALRGHWSSHPMRSSSSP